MSDGDLVAKGRPFGERQKTEGLMRQAGLPTDSASLAGPPDGVAASAPPPPPANRTAPTLSQDPLQVLTPGSPLVAPLTPQERLRAIAEQTSNPLFHLIAARVADDVSA